MWLKCGSEQSMRNCPYQYWYCARLDRVSPNAWRQFSGSFLLLPALWYGYRAATERGC
jgi:hypothetical protein